MWSILLLCRYIRQSNSYAWFMYKEDLIIHENVRSLTAKDQELLRHASEFTNRAYAPYSGFYVGAVVHTRTGQTIGGANQENASYPLCMCGERIALYNCAMHYPNERIDTLAIVARGKNEGLTPAPPCGACLQVIREFETRQGGEPIRLLLKANADVVWEAPSTKVMLPYAFDGSFLE